MFFKAPLPRKKCLPGFAALLLLCCTLTAQTLSHAQPVPDPTIGHEPGRRPPINTAGWYPTTVSYAPDESNVVVTACTAERHKLWKPILVSELVKTPEGLIAFMKVAIQVPPNGYLDTVTRNHDVEYSLRITSVFAPVHGNVSLQKRCTTQLQRRNSTTVETYRSRLLPRRACFRARGGVNQKPNILGNFHQNLYARKPLSA